jgi:ferredoxin--NADP+ reductase
MTAWLEGTVIDNRHWTPALFSLRVELASPRFEAGQFVRIALDIDGERVARPFSLVNAPGDAVSEFYGVVVPQGRLSPQLGRMAAGDTLYVADNPSGFLVLSEVPDAESLWMLSTGTGVAPFLSILRDEAAWRRYGTVVLVHAVRRRDELVYRELIDALQHAHGVRLRYVPVVSRESAPPALAGRIPDAIRDGRLERAAGLPLSADNSQVMVCGNPDMLKDASAALAERGIRKHRRRAPGHVTTEAFW